MLSTIIVLASDRPIFDRSLIIIGNGFDFERLIVC